MTLELLVADEPATADSVAGDLSAKPSLRPDPTPAAPPAETEVPAGPSTDASSAAAGTVAHRATGAPSATQRRAAPSAWRRHLGTARGPRPEGEPTLLCFGGVHGNEPSGYQAIERVLERLRLDPTGLRGSFVGLGGNLQALERRQRFLRHDLNRHFTPDRVEALRAETGPLEAEDAELRQIDIEVREIFAAATGPVFGLDIHTTSGEGPCFAVLDDTLPNRSFAIQQPATLVVGLEEELAGTITHYVSELGAREYGFEAGQHDDPRSVDRAEAALWLALEGSGVIEPGVRPEVAAGRALLETETRHLPHVVEVRYRHALGPSDQFVMEPGFTNLQPVRAGQILARDQRGPILAPETGLILMPLYQAQGEDGFFIVRRLHPVWLRISKWVRTLGVDRILHRLPGVSRHPELEDTYVADRRWARLFALELFHLLGYRRRGPAGRFVVLTRRPHDL